MTTQAVGGRRLLVVVAMTGIALFGCAATIAVAPTLNGDNYCGRLYFDTNRSGGCRDTMAMRSVWVVVLAGAGVAVLAGVIGATRQPRLLLAALLAAMTLGAVLVGFNRLLQDFGRNPSSPMPSGDMATNANGNLCSA